MAKYGIRGVIGGGSAEGGTVERHMLGRLMPGAASASELGEPSMMR
jgi:hypothetical protein